MASKKDQELPGESPENAALPAPPLGEAAPPAPAAVPSAVTKTPAEWAKALGHTKERDRRIPQSLDHVDPAYAVADRLYGWSQHAYDFQAEGESFQLSEATYCAAVKSASHFPAVALVADALTPAQAVALKDHAPARNLKTERAAAAAEKAEAEAAAKKGNG